MLDKIITYSFYLLFFLTPLFWTSKNYELFEYNKMILTYGITVIIVGCWLLKIINRKSLIFNRTPLDIPLLLFLAANILSTIFSIDHHTSIWGYYSRSNGGLLSLISYLLLYWAFVSNMNKEKVFTTLKFGLLSAIFISFWGIFEHFGISPSCLILRGELNASCWVQDVQARVFATLGQPNWMAAYLSMLIFPALYFFLTATTTKQRITYFISIMTSYLAFTFTYSRGPTLGLIASLFLLITFQLKNIKPILTSRLTLFPIFVIGFSLLITLFSKYFPPALGYIFLLLVTITIFIISLRLLILNGIKLNILQRLLILVALFSLINLHLGSSLTSFRLVSKFAPPPRPAIGLPGTSTQLETGGTESGQIRFIVWQGALDIFKHSPIFGSGVETFAYSYYQFRPASHNLTSEWDFLYNKAHNEYLNYLATTGILGFTTYMLVIITFITWSLKRLFAEISHSVRDDNNRILLTTIILASYTSYLVYNFFLFSVVIVALFFYLFPALAFVATESTRPFKWPKKLYPIPYTLYPILYRRSLYTKIAKGTIILLTFYFLFSIFQLWYADTIFAAGERSSETGNPGSAYNLLSQAVALNADEPFYRSELGYSAAAAAAALAESDATLSAQLKTEAITQTETVLKLSPNNVSFWRTAIRTYFELANLDKSYIETTLQALDHTIKLAPTDPKLLYNKALILDIQGKKDDEIKVLQQATELKPNYLEALSQLKEATSSAK